MKYELTLAIRQLTGCETFEQLEKYITTMKQYAPDTEPTPNETAKEIVGYLTSRDNNGIIDSASDIINFITDKYLKK